MTYQLLQGDALAMLRTLPDESVHCGVTSPPYFGLRDYGADGQIGLEPTPEEYVARLVDVFREFRRVLRDDGTLWVNIGDSYNNYRPGAYHDDRAHSFGGPRTDDKKRGMPDSPASSKRGRKLADVKEKDLIGIPWMLAFALRADGWWLRSDVIWHKPNPMPESVTDRPTKAHEYLFLLTKSARYFYDAQAIAEPAQQWPGQAGTFARNGAVSDHVLPGQAAAQHRSERTDRVDGATRNRRSVWTVATEPTPYAHFATMPTALVEPCILAGTSARGCCPVCGAPWVRVVERGEAKRIGGDAGVSVAHAEGPMNRNGNGQWDEGHMPMVRPTATTGWTPTCTCNAGAPVPATVLDPFAGSGTTLRVAINLGRDAIGIELNPEYVALAERLLGQTQPALMGV